MGIVKVLYGCTFKKGLGDRFHGREVEKLRLGLDGEELDDIVRRVVGEVMDEAKR